MVINFANINKTNSHLSSYLNQLNTKKTQGYDPFFSLCGPKKGPCELLSLLLIFCNLHIYILKYYSLKFTTWHLLSLTYNIFFSDTTLSNRNKISKNIPLVHLILIGYFGVYLKFKVTTWFNNTNWLAELFLFQNTCILLLK